MIGREAMLEKCFNARIENAFMGSKFGVKWGKNREMLTGF